MRIHRLTLGANIDLPTQVAVVMLLGICAGCDHSFNRCFVVEGDTHVGIDTRDAALARVDRVAVRWGFNAESAADVAFEGNLRHYNLPNTGRGRFITLSAREVQGGLRVCLGEFLAGRETPLFASIWGELVAEPSHQSHKPDLRLSGCRR